MEAIEGEMGGLIASVPSIHGLDFNGDSLGNATVSLVFANGAANGFATGLWKIFQD